MTHTVDVLVLAHCVPYPKETQFPEESAASLAHLWV